MRKMPILPVTSTTKVRSAASRSMVGSRSKDGCSHQSASPRCMAAAAVATSGMTVHSTRSKKARLRPGGAGGDAILPRAVALEPLVHRAGAHHALVRQEAERAAAHHLRNLLERIGQRQAFRHDRQHVDADLAQRLRQQRERRLEAEGDGAVVRGGQLVRHRHQGLAERIPPGPAPDAGHAIPRQHRRAVVEQQPVPQPQRPAPAAIRDDVPLHHLRLHLQRVVLPVQRVEHEVAVVARDVDRGPDRIECRDIGLRDEPQHAAALRPHDGGGRQRPRCQRAHARPHQRTPLHRHNRDPF